MGFRALVARVEPATEAGSTSFAAEHATHRRARVTADGLSVEDVEPDATS